MLNYILPPIIIIVSVSYLIIFLFRKAEQIPEGEFDSGDKSGRNVKRTSAVASAVGQLMLKILERIMHRAKLMSLKFHNTSNEWFQTIREKRQSKIRSDKEVAQRNIEEEGVPEQEVVAQQTEPQQETFSQNQNVRRPMVGRTITRPVPARIIKRKNELEGVLIKRIAINPKDIEAYERLGDYYLESENFQDSLECFKQVLRLSPTHQKARLRIKRLEKIAR